MKREPKGPDTTRPMEVAGLDMCLRNWDSKDAREEMLGIEAAVIMYSKKQEWGMLRIGKVLFQYQD